MLTFSGIPLLDLVLHVFYVNDMDWEFAIERYRGPLLGHVVRLFAMIGLTEGVTIERVSKPLYRQVLGVLRTAESAVRRLIIAAARDIVVEPKPRRPSQAGRKSSGESKGQGKGKAKRKRGIFFKLFDPPKRFRKFFGRRGKRRRAQPRVTVIGYDPRIPEFLRGQPAAPAAAPVPEVAETIDDGTVNAGPLIRRLLAIKDALEDIPRQARRYARWRDTPIEDRHPQRESALRFGRPPGWRTRPTHEVHEILKECHWLARNVQPTLDTS